MHLKKQTEDENIMFTYRKKRFLKKLKYTHDSLKRGKRFTETIGYRLLVWLFIGIIFGISLWSSSQNNFFQNSSIYCTSFIWLISLPFFIWNNLRKEILFWTGLEGRPSIGWNIWFGISTISSIFLSIYLFWPYLGTFAQSGELFKESNLGVIPAVLSFSLPVLSATFSGIAITFSNNSKISLELRSKSLRVAHKLILATIFFISIVILYFFLTLFIQHVGQVNPNSFAWGWPEFEGGLLFWFSELSLALGPWLFIIGSGELLAVFVKSRKVTESQ